MNSPNRKPAGRNRRIRAAQAAATRRIAGQKATKVLDVHLLPVVLLVVL